MYQIVSLFILNAYIAKAYDNEDTERGCGFEFDIRNSGMDCHSDNQCCHTVYESKLCCCDMYTHLPRPDYRPRCNLPRQCEIRTIFVKPFCKLSLNCYIEKTLCVIRQNEKHCDEDRICRIRRILCIIYKNLKCDINELALFTATALHNTSYFRCWENKSEDCERYHSRGLLMIREKGNYERLDCVAKNNHDYVSCPSKLAKDCEYVIVDTICFWKDVVRHKCLTFDLMMQALNPWEYREFVKTGKKVISWINRENLYHQLYQFYKK